MTEIVNVWIALKLFQCLRLAFLVDLVYYSQDPQVLFSTKFSLKLDLMTLLTHSKIILLQCFQFSVFSNKRYLNRL